MASRRIVLFNAKGGCGKTTLAWNLAAGLAQRGSTLLLDADPQGSLGRWAEWSEAEGEGMTVAGSHLLDGDLATLKQPYVVVDCPPALEAQETQKALVQAHMVLVPVLPSPLDLWASQRSVEAIQAILQQRKSVRAALVLNQAEGRSALSRAAEHAIATLGLPVLSVQVARRAIYRNAAVEGKSVYQMGKRGTAAVAEIEELIEEVLK
ncbi:ParA family partition ATPase [Acidithiobacillus acidisediminis]|jgi:chromosome partitioning protein|uniref:ParA family partition ATPase n=1 Tax=Acidithiobacillus TaxID=119977 RepID=UPI00200D03E7|nr:ParA family partition ATPase [Acidithiobacillus sp. S30A2]